MSLDGCDIDIPEIPNKFLDHDFDNSDKLAGSIKFEN